MSVSYSNTVKDTRMTDVLTAIDAGTAGSLEICSAAYAAVLVSIPLAHPSFSEASQVLTALGVPLSGTAGNTGTAAVARIKSSAGTVIVNSLTVGTSATDIVLNSVSITSGQTVTLSSLTLTAAA
jgi:hypothetical protein